MTRGAASIPLGMVRSVRKPDTRRGHVKYAGLQLSTIRKYNLAIKRFFVWLDSAEKTVPVSLEELDEAVGEYINHLYQDDLPVGWASDVVWGNFSIPSAVSHCRFQQGTCEIGTRVCPGHRLFR